MRLFVLNEDLRVRWEGVGSLTFEGKSIVNRDGQALCAVGPKDLVITPTGNMIEPELASWRFIRAADGSAMFFCPRRKEAGYYYLSGEEVNARADEENGNCFAAYIETPSRWFRQIDATENTDHAFSDDDYLTYEEDGQRSPNDSFGPATTHIP